MKIENTGLLYEVNGKIHQLIELIDEVTGERTHSRTLCSPGRKRRGGWIGDDNKVIGTEDKVWELNCSKCKEKLISI
jgi:hypothetical protein